MCGMTLRGGSYMVASKSQNLSMIGQSLLSRKHTKTGGRSRLVPWARDSVFLKINSPVKCRAGQFPLSNKMALKEYLLFIKGHKCCSLFILGKTFYMYVPSAFLRYHVVGGYPPSVCDILPNPCNLKVVLNDFTFLN